MNYYEIKCGTSYGSCSMAKLLIERIKPENIKAVRLNTATWPAPENSEDWPCVFICNLSDERLDGLFGDFEIRIEQMTSGYCGTGPHDLRDCLRAAGFGQEYISDEGIFGEKFNHLVIQK